MIATLVSKDGMNDLRSRLKNQKGIDIFVHDSQRKIETQYSNYFLTPNCELITEIIESKTSKFPGRKLSHYKTK